MSNYTLCTELHKCQYCTPREEAKANVKKGDGEKGEKKTKKMKEQEKRDSLIS